MMRLWVLVIIGLCLFPPWCLLFPEGGSPLFLGHGWLWAPPLVGAPVGIDYRVLGLEVVGVGALFGLLALVRLARRRWL